MCSGNQANNINNGNVGAYCEKNKSIIIVKLMIMISINITFKISLQNSENTESNAYQ